MNPRAKVALVSLLVGACGGGEGYQVSQTGGNGAGGAGGTAAGGAGGGTTNDTGGSSACRPVAPCPSGWYQYSDTVCSPPYLGSGPGCQPKGDGMCYPLCQSTAECTDPRFPTCGALTVFDGSDAGRQKAVCLPTSGLPRCPAADADADAGGTGGSAGGTGDACSAALPIACGDRLSHSTAVEGRVNLWGGYGLSARAESGRETVYAFSSAVNCGVVARLDGLSTDLDLAVLSGCDPMGANLAISSTPLDLQTVETVRWTSRPGATFYVVVDGYAGAQGSYTLQLDCTCE